MMVHNSCIPCGKLRHIAGTVLTVDGYEQPRNHLILKAVNVFVHVLHIFNGNLQLLHHELKIRLLNPVPA